MYKALNQYKDAAFLFCLTGSIVTLPFSIRFNSIAIILLLVSWLFKNSFKEKLRNLRRPLVILPLGLYLVHIIGMLWTENIPHGIFELEKKLSILLFPMILGSINPLSKEELKKILYCFVGACLIAALVCLGYATYRTLSTSSTFEVNPESNYVTRYFFYFGLSEIFIHPVYFSAYIVFAICILFKMIGSIETPKKKLWNALTVTAIIYLIAFLCLLSSRIMIIGFLFIVLTYSIFSFFKNGITGFKIGVSMCVLITILLAVIYIPAIRNRFEEIVTSDYHFKSNPETNGNLSGKVDGIQMKLAQWHFTVEAGKKEWLIGVGTGDDEDALLSEYKENNFMEGYVPRYNSHNQYLQTWLGLGAVGLFVLLIAFIGSLFIAVKRKQVIYIAFLFIVVLFCLTESVLCRQQGIVFYAFFNSLFLFHFLGSEKKFTL